MYYQNIQNMKNFKGNIIYLHVHFRSGQKCTDTDVKYTQREKLLSQCRDFSSFESRGSIETNQTKYSIHISVYDYRENKNML